MSKLSLLTPSLLLSLSLMTACGGGGSKTPSEPSESPSSSSVVSLSSLSLSSLPLSSLSSSALSSSVSSSVSSSIAASSSSLASSSSVANLSLEKVSGVIEYKDTDGSAVELEDAAAVAITLSLLDEQDQVISSKSVAVPGSAVAQNSALPFSGEVSGANAKFLVVQISKAGFTDYARRFDVAAELSIKAVLTRVPAEVISESTAVTISGQAVDGFNFSVSDQDAPQVADLGAGIADLTVSIPKSALPAGTTSIDVKMQAFNPNDINDSQRFPGAYADSDGNKLLSVAFNYTDITTDKGVSLQKLAAASASGNRSLLKKLGWNKEAAEPVIINRKIPQESCSALKQMGDSSKTLPGFQVPVYTYNPGNGLWDLLGQGTLYAGDGEAIAENFTAFDCTSNDYVLEIKVSNEIFISKWWNLDYPLVFSQPVKMCADIQLLDEASHPIANNIVYVYDNDDDRNFSTEVVVTDVNGKAHIEAFSLDPVSTDTSVELVLYAAGYTSVIKKPITLSTSCAVSAPIIIKTTLPAVCKVDGVVKDKISGQLLQGLPVIAMGANDVPAMPAFGLTDTQGKYSLDVGCSQDYSLIDYFVWIAAFAGNTSTTPERLFSVNSSVADSESTDDGKKVVMQDTMVDRSKPLGLVISGSENGVEKIVVESIYAGTAYPLSYSFDLMDLRTNKLYGHYSGTLTKDDLVSFPDAESFGASVGFVKFPSTIDWPSESVLLSVKGEIKDAAGAKSNMWGYISQETASDEFEADDEFVEDEE